jgi:hypothetical protein
MIKKVIIFGGLVVITTASFAQITLDDLVSTGLYATDVPGISVCLITQIPSESRAQYFIKRFDAVNNRYFLNYRTLILQVPKSIGNIINAGLVDCRTAPVLKIIKNLLMPPADEQQRIPPYTWYLVRAKNYAFRDIVKNYYDPLKEAVSIYIQQGGVRNIDTETAEEVVAKLESAMKTWMQYDEDYLALLDVVTNPSPDRKMVQNKLKALTALEEKNQLFIVDDPSVSPALREKIKEISAIKQKARDIIGIIRSLAAILNPSVEEQQKGAHPHEWYTARATNYVFRRDVERYYDELKAVLADYLMKAGGRGDNDVYTAADVLKKLSASINVWKQDDVNYLALSVSDPKNLSQLQDKLDALTNFEKSNTLLFGENDSLSAAMNAEIKSILAKNETLRTDLDHRATTKENARTVLSSMIRCTPNDDMQQAQSMLEKLMDEFQNSSPLNRAVYAKNINSCIASVYNHLQNVPVLTSEDVPLVNAAKRLDEWGLAVSDDVLKNAQSNLDNAFQKAKSDFGILQAYEWAKIIKQEDKITFELTLPNETKFNAESLSTLINSFNTIHIQAQGSFQRLIQTSRLYFSLKGIIPGRGKGIFDRLKGLTDKSTATAFALEKEVVALMRAYNDFKSKISLFIRLLERVAQGWQQLALPDYVSALSQGEEIESTTGIDQAALKQKREALLTTFAASVAVLDAANVFTDKSPEEKDEIVKNALPYVLQTYRNLNKVAGKKDTPLIAEGIRLINMFNDVFRKPSAYYIDMAKIK